MGQIKAYISHSIRGKFGIGATAEQMEVNNQRAIDFGKLCNKEFPQIKWYIPGEHDELVMIAFDKGYMTEKIILDIDCAIIDKCQFMLVFSPDDYISRGMQIEIDHCNFTHKKIISAVNGGFDAYWNRLKESINCYLTTLMR